MNTSTVTAAASTTRTAASRGYFARLLGTLRTELRRALELAGAPYADGALPPL